MKYLTFLRASTYTIDMLAIVANVYLLRVVRAKTDSRSEASIMTQTTCVIGLLNAVALMIFVPCYFMFPGMLVIIPGSPLAHQYCLMMISVHVWVLTIVILLMIDLVSFVHRWALITRPQLSRKLSKFRIIPAMIVLYTTVILSDVLAMFNSPHELRPEVRERLGPMYPDFDFESDLLWIMGFELLKPLRLICAAGSILVVLSAAAGVAAYCGYGIHVEIKSAQFSKFMRRAHGRTLRLLIAQIMCPCICVFIAAFVTLIAAMGRFSIGSLPQAFIIGLISFPLANPIVIMIFTESYKNHVLRKTSTSVVFSMSRRSSVHSSGSRRLSDKSTKSFNG